MSPTSYQTAPPRRARLSRALPAPPPRDRPAGREVVTDLPRNTRRMCQGLFEADGEDPDGDPDGDPDADGDAEPEGVGEGEAVVCSSFCSAASSWPAVVKSPRPTA